MDADIVFHQGSRFYSANLGCNGDGFYIENTGAHEFGHALGLEHSSVETATMWPNSGACETIRETPDPDDIAGLGSLYPGSSSPAPTTAPSAPSQLAVGVSASSPTSSLVLTWADTATNETGYRVERSPNGLSFAICAARIGCRVVRRQRADVGHCFLLSRLCLQFRRRVGLHERRLGSDAG